MIDSQVSTLTTMFKQLNQKKTQITLLDVQIAESIETPKDLELKYSKQKKSKASDNPIETLFEQRSQDSTRPLDVHATEFMPTLPRAVASKFWVVRFDNNSDSFVRG